VFLPVEVIEEPVRLAADPLDLGEVEEVEQLTDRVGPEVVDRTATRRRLLDELRAPVPVDERAGSAPRAQLPLAEFACLDIRELRLRGCRPGVVELAQSPLVDEPTRGLGLGGV